MPLRSQQSLPTEDELNTDFLKDLTMTPENGAADVQECVAIEKVRLSVPTAFSSISYELTTQNKLYVKVGGINLAEAIYEEVYEENNVRYRCVIRWIHRTSSCSLQ